ncbi:MAG: hypothetical protein PHE21_02770 [Candidatus Dojkabacteria bacterium]|nr:hypothetical protein [Candidatus Dojkabacteria bacterium]
MKIITLILNMFKPRGVFAQGLGASLGQTEIDNTTDANSLVELIIEIAIPFAVTCVVLLIIYAGYILMSSQGNPDKIKEGKEILTNAIIGFVVVALSVGILLLLSDTLNLNIYE